MSNIIIYVSLLSESKMVMRAPALTLTLLYVFATPHAEHVGSINLINSCLSND